MKAAPVLVKNALVTGCSSGIGRATARVLRDRGWRVIPTARKDEDLDQLRAEGFEPVRIDVADESSVKHAAARALEILGGQLGALVNNAGFGQAGAVEDLTRETLRYQFEVNVLGLQDLTNRIIPTFRKQGWGRIVNISSVLGRVVIPFYGSYCATKFAVEALSDNLRIELHGTGIAVCIVEPGPIVSQFRKNAAERAQATLDPHAPTFGPMYEKEIARRMRQQKKPDAFTKPPEAVAEKIVHALESPRPKARYCVTLPAYLGAFAARFVPTSLMDLARTRKLKM
ncbi:MAG TPA: SDR family NAD(P)-dependent oxidoreductase [Kiritimatiellia bacterium]|jgi:NAD(P)-dependent dehydrogenase (short-subunit alcohol dehydrogenase family)